MMYVCLRKFPDIENCYICSREDDKTGKYVQKPAEVILQLRAKYSKSYCIVTLFLQCYNVYSSSMTKDHLNK